MKKMFKYLKHSTFPAFFFPARIIQLHNKLLLIMLTDDTETFVNV